MQMHRSIDGCLHEDLLPNLSFYSLRKKTNWLQDALGNSEMGPYGSTKWARLAFPALSCVDSQAEPRACGQEPGVGRQ